MLVFLEAILGSWIVFRKVISLLAKTPKNSLAGALQLSQKATGRG